MDKFKSSLPMMTLKSHPMIIGKRPKLPSSRQLGRLVPQLGLRSFAPGKTKTETLASFVNVEGVFTKHEMILVPPSLRHLKCWKMFEETVNLCRYRRPMSTGMAFHPVKNWITLAKIHMDCCSRKDRERRIVCIVIYSNFLCLR